MSKRNSRYNIFKHIRMALRSAPLRQELHLRAMLAARVEADEATGEIFGRDGKTPREVLAETANIRLEGSLKVALKAMKEAGLFKSHRIYSNGDRKGADRLVLDWDAWDEHYEKLVLNAVQELAASSTGHKELAASSAGHKGGGLTGHKGDGLTGHNSNKETAISNGDSNGDSGDQPPGAPLRASPPPDAHLADASEAPSPLPPPAVELQTQQRTPGCELDGSVSWVERDKIVDRKGKALPQYGQAVYYDRGRAKLCLVNDERGKAFYQALREEYSIDVIKRAIVAATVKAPSTAPRDSGLEALVRTYCGYEANRTINGTPRAGGYAKADGAPRTFGAWE